MYLLITNKNVNQSVDDKNKRKQQQQQQQPDKFYGVYDSICKE